MIRPLLLALATLCALSFIEARAADAPLRVLFLGDRGHHVPADRAAQLIPVMASRGIEVDYTEKLSDLNAKTLGRYDALLIYANIDKIEDDQVKALLDYVAKGGGFVPVHCASFCFHNSPEYIALVGAEFQRHGTDVFDVKTLDPNHPTMKGLEPFRTWDETYVHHKHNEKDRTVLQTRADRDHDEPWTWVRTHGKGRVFYTAYGHDARTWGHPGFHDLIERGVRWAAAKGEVRDGRPRVASAGLKPFEYGTGKVPNYVPSAKWGTQAEPIRRVQKPLAPAESAKHMVAPSGFEVKLFAAEPEITKPITMAWDHRGRLWIVETTDYPNDKRSSKSGNDRIKILEDTDGDGRADKFTVFAEGLNIPTSLVFSNGGVIVHQAPDTLFMKDNDGDDKVDEDARADHWLGHQRHARRPEQPALRLRQLDLRHRRLLVVPRQGRRRGAQLRPGALSVQARRLEARVPAQHEQQLVGRRLQRGRPAVRLDGQRLPERLPADPQPLL